MKDDIVPRDPSYITLEPCVLCHWRFESSNVTFPQIKSQPPLWAKNYARCVAEIQWCFTFQIAHTLIEDLGIEPDSKVC